MKDCKPGKVRNPKTNRCASPSTIKKQKSINTENETHPDLPRKNGRCVHVSKLTKLTLAELKKVTCEHQIITPTRATKKLLVDQILIHLGIEVENKCKDGHELNPETNRCRKKCSISQTRDPKTKRCRKIV